MELIYVIYNKCKNDHPLVYAKWLNGEKNNCDNHWDVV